QLGERLDDRRRGGVELARLLERVQRRGAVAVGDDLERGDLGQKGHALARLADLVELFARRLERLVEVARLPGAAAADGGDPALARQPLGRAERLLRGVELLHRRREHRDRAEEEGAARGVALAQLLGVALERRQLGGPRILVAGLGLRVLGARLLPRQLVGGRAFAEALEVGDVRVIFLDRFQRRRRWRRRRTHGLTFYRIVCRFESG